MSDSTGVVLAATSISFVNKWASTGNVDLAIPLAGGFVSLIFSGVEKLDHTAGVGLAYMMLITVLFTSPAGGNAPPSTVLKWLGLSMPVSITGPTAPAGPAGSQGVLGPSKGLG